MSDDWAKKYIDIHKQKQQEKLDAQERAKLARSVAPDMFQRIKKQVQRDIQTLHAAGVLLSLRFNDSGEDKFSVSDTASRSSPHQATVVVVLKTIIVEYVHFFPKKDEEGMDDRDSGTLRICSNLDGVAQVYRNGKGWAFVDEAEVSEFLLKPLLEYVESQ